METDLKQNKPIIPSGVPPPTPVVPLAKPVLSSGIMATFRALLDGAAAGSITGVISNRFPWQSKMACEKLLEVAKKEKLPIRILSGGCPDGFYNPDFSQKISDCADSGCPFIRVLIWRKNPEGISQSLKKLADEGKIELRISGTDEFASTVPHFLLVGEHAFRQEAGHPPFTPNTIFTDTEPQVSARIDFNDSETGKALAEVFDKLWGTA